MALFQVVIEKKVYDFFFVNDYTVSVPSLGDALSATLAIANIEKAVFTDSVLFEKARFRPVDQAQQGTIVPLTGTGLRGDTTQFMPIFNVARVDFTPQYGRVGRKYLRLPLTDADVNQFALQGSFRNMIQSVYVDPIVNLGYVCKPNGSLFTGGSVYPQVQMRQVRRGSKKATRPIL